MPETITVVCVDDDEDILELLRVNASYLEDIEIVAMSSNIAEASPLLRKLKPDVLVVDHDFGAVTRERGLDAIERSRVPVVVFTGLPGLAISARNAGAFDLVEKPRLELLWEAVRRAARAKDSSGQS